ncbi:hypothetical protein [Nocardia thraciensis]
MAHARDSARSYGKSDPIDATPRHGICWPGAKAKGDGGMEALRILERRLSDVVYRAMIADLDHQSAETPIAA